MMDATKTQIGGSHYKSMAVQPLEFGYLNQYDACTYSAIKYVSRHRAKDGLEGLKKAKHCVEFRFEMIAANGNVRAVERMSIDHYIRANGFTGLEKVILLNLHYWATDRQHPELPLSDIAVKNLICGQIDRLIAEAYPEPKEPQE